MRGDLRRWPRPGLLTRIARRSHPGGTRTAPTGGLVFKWALVAWCAAAVTVVAQSQPSEWVRREQLSSALSQRLSITLQDTPVRDALRQLSQASRVTIWLDRRVDPSQRVDLQPAEKSLLEWLEQIAQQTASDIGRAGPVIYLGPPETARSIATRCAVIEQAVTELAPDLRRPWMVRKPLRWDYLTSPGEVWDEVTSALQGCAAAYYLVHSMLSSGGNYAQADRELATKFARASSRATWCRRSTASR